MYLWCYTYGTVDFSCDEKDKCVSVFCTKMHAVFISINFMVRTCAFSLQKVCTKSSYNMNKLV